MNDRNAIKRERRLPVVQLITNFIHKTNSNNKHQSWEQEEDGGRLNHKFKEQHNHQYRQHSSYPQNQLFISPVSFYFPHADVILDSDQNKVKNNSNDFSEYLLSENLSNGSNFIKNLYPRMHCVYITSRSKDL